SDVCSSDLAAQQEKVRSYVRLGVEEGARLVTGGAEPVEGREGGYYVRPTVFADVRNDMRIAQEEIFGPVLALIPYDSVEEAVTIANDTVYGLNAAVWSGEAADRKSTRLNSSHVSISYA